MPVRRLLFVLYLVSVALHAQTVISIPNGTPVIGAPAGANGQGFTNRGPWASATAYNAYDVLTYGGQTYLVTANFTSPNTFDTTNLLLWAAKGADGAAGSQGPQGPQGPTGSTGSAGSAGQGFTNRNAWTPSTAYNAYDVLTNGGQTYLVTANFTSPSTFNTTNLLLWAARGADAPVDNQTAGAGGVTVNLSVVEDTSNPIKFILPPLASCGSGIADRTASSGAAFVLYDFNSGPPILVTTDAGGATAGHILIGSTTVQGTMMDSGQTSSNSVPIGTTICGVAQSTVSGGATVLMSPRARGSVGKKVDNLNGTVLSTLATGLLKNTTGTGAPSIAVPNVDYASADVNPVTGMSLEYPLTEGSGTTATDISGNGNNGTFGVGTAAPTWNAYGVALYDTGTTRTPNEYITTPLTSWKTAVITYCTPTMAQTTGTSIVTGPANNFGQLVGPIAGATQGVGFIGTGIGVGFTITFTPSLYLYASSTNPSLASDGVGGCHTVASTLDTLDHFWIDGKETNYSTQSTSAASATLSTGTYLLGQGIRGVIAYVDLYPTARTATEIQSITAFQQRQVAKRGSFPHYPYFNNSRTAQGVYVGDSLTATYLGSSQWTASVVTNNTYNVSNWGYVGMFAYDMCKVTDQRWVSSIVPGQTVVHLWGGTNDVASSRTPQDAWTSISACVAKAHQYGARIIVSTMISRTTLDTNKNLLDALIRTGCPIIGCDYVNDLAMVPAIGANGASSNSACYQDGIHLTGPGAGTCATIGGTALSGYGIIAALDSNATNTLDGSSKASPDISASNAFVETYANNYIIQTPTAAATHQLVDVLGQTSPRTIVNGSPTFSITVNTTNSQTILGTTVIPPSGTGTFIPTLAGPTTGGGYWTSVIAATGSATGVSYPPAGIPTSTGTAWGSSKSIPAGNLVDDSSAQTVSGKNFPRRTATTTSSATPAINTDSIDLYIITAQAVPMTSLTTNLSGTPTEGRLFELDMKDNGTAQALSFGSSFVASGTVALPTTTVAGVKLHMLFSWDSSIGKFVLLAVS